MSRALSSSEWLASWKITKRAARDREGLAENQRRESAGTTTVRADPQRIVALSPSYTLKSNDMPFVMVHFDTHSWDLRMYNVGIRYK